MPSGFIYRKKTGTGEIIGYCPIKVKDDTKKMLDAMKKKYAKNGREPSMDDIIRQLGNHKKKESAFALFDAPTFVDLD